MNTKPVPKGVEITGSITKHMDRRFLSSVDLTGLDDQTVTVERVEKLEKLEYVNGSSDDNAILIYFKGSPKPLKLCATNIRAIVARCGSVKVEDWKGKKLILKVEKVKAFGKMVDAIRVQ